MGKSTLINVLLGADLLDVQPVRATDSRGRHTTTHRELVPVPGGALLIDTPGMRELRLWDQDAGSAGAFSDVEQLARDCRFADCMHRSEPSCAVQSAIADGTLALERCDSYLKLERELRSAERRRARKQRMAERSALKAKREREDRSARRDRRQRARTARRDRW